MRIGILGNSGSWYCDDIAHAAKVRRHDCTRLEFPRLFGQNGRGKAADWCLPSDETTLTGQDAILIRTMPPGSLEQVVFRMDLLARAELTGLRFINSPRSIECAVDKFLTTARLEAAGLPVPPTVVCQDAETALEAFAQLGGDVVVKPLFGAEGRGICRVSDPDLAFRTFRTLQRLDAVLYLQQFVPHPGYDTRILVLNGRVLGGMRRFGDGDFRTNVSRRGRCEGYSPTDSECESAIQAAHAVGTVFAGVDLLTTSQSHAESQSSVTQSYVIEVNGVPGWRAFNRVNQTDTAALLIRHLEDGAC